MKKQLSPRYLLPMMIMVGLLVVFMRVGDIWDAVSTGKLSAHAAYAETAAAATTKDTASQGATPVPTDKKATPSAPPETDTSNYAPDDQERSPAEIDILNQLSKRREALDKRNRELDTREALIKVAETRVDQKIKEMETLRQQLLTMVNQVSEAQATQVENLVKIYETMKPEEAARILETLDMPVLLGVIQRMKPARTAPIMAKMPPEKAKEITVALTKQDQLPQIK